MTSTKWWGPGRGGFCMCQAVLPRIQQGGRGLWLWARESIRRGWQARGRKGPDCRHDRKDSARDKAATGCQARVSEAAPVPLTP